MNRKSPTVVIEKTVVVEKCEDGGVREDGLSLTLDKNALPFELLFSDDLERISSFTERKEGGGEEEMEAGKRANKEYAL
ncbi:hypothetical protein L1887_18443 [Cichorium endivia]|nr:hypothetical protein L1887_18443 [Cichorium endivia]